ncbi:ATP-dependent DNA helicase RecG [Halioxenophilus sp. WMMB6]|uniref:ATP-dependent DNA helicase RecG n=1 Tax=Halioxenophilus sp. WMMB6 TaxID=3073815 RepID=UPI00295F14B7|nr:ATP-dependent DNA helicase RecG [Halioxenophilus sp. WMMB6]
MTAGSRQPPFELTPITALKGVGPQLAAKLEKLGIRCFRDLLFHLPLRYIDQTHITPIGELQPGSYAVVEAHIQGSQVVFGKRRSLVCRIADDSGTTQLRFFHFSAAQKERLAPGQLLRVFGEARRGAAGLEFYHPETTLISADTPLPEGLTPIYPSTEGISQKKWLQLTEQLLERCGQTPIEDLIPKEIQPLSGRAAIADILSFLHRPPRSVNAQDLTQRSHPLQQRLALEELLAHHLSLRQQRWRSQGSGYALQPALPLTKQFLQQLPFIPTAAQVRVHQEVSADLARKMPMRRLVQGDVGSGKTLIAALACLPAVAAGKQVAVMAPTEILAEQHFQNFCRWLEPLGLRVGWLTGRLTAKQRQTTQEGITRGDLQVLVGTQALFQESVTFDDLALVIIDEQHRFGVFQRLALQQKNERAKPHLLLLTATPIPRTLAMSLYASLDISVIDELPPGRTAIKTVTVNNERRAEVITRVGGNCAQGRQAYWVCTLIDESETLQAQAAEELCQSLQKALPTLTIGLIHGRMSGSDKDRQMARFKAGELQLLVATTVIEVGVDVPNASLMIIENPERLGLAQLHQLRGRVGRGTAESHCVLLYQKPLGKTARQRLEVMKTTSDGFVIAEEDMKLRGPGEVLGTRQTGDIQFRIADLSQHQALLPHVETMGETLFTQYPERVTPLIERWLAEREQFAEA